ncbi:hypothetical protein [Hymenobacter gelipurpurascens]|nr:hypothetical protein [Hymenobacter gelipurpurascens]
MQQFPNTTTGVAVHFGSQAHYGSLVRAIDYLNQLDVKKYTIDITSPTTTALYAFTDARQQPRPLSIPTPIILAATPTSATARWLQQVGAPLQHSAWGTALLACLGVMAVGAACYVLREVA